MLPGNKQRQENVGKWWSWRSLTLLCECHTLQFSPLFLSVFRTLLCAQVIDWWSRPRDGHSQKSSPLQVVAPASPYLVLQGMKYVWQAAGLDQCPVGNEGRVLLGSRPLGAGKLYTSHLRKEEIGEKWEKIGTIPR